jgi:hypothetical protein
VLDSLSGLGTGSLREHYDRIVAGDGRFILSGGSSKARGLSEAELAGKRVEFGNPNLLVRLALEHDRVINY